MCDKELIGKICNLTCNKKDVNLKNEEIKYDLDHPFKKYYSVEIIMKAINKYLSKEWDDVFLARWACTYMYIICGGYKDEVVEELNPIEWLVKELIVWELDGISFFDDESKDYLDEWIQSFKSLDLIFKTSNKWNGLNDDEYVVFVNDEDKQYVICSIEFLDEEYDKKYIKQVSREEQINIVKDLQKTGYTLLSCNEKYYFEDIDEE